MEPHPAYPRTSRDAFKVIFERQKTQDLIFRWLRKLKIPRRYLRDVSQEVFLAAWQSFHTFDAAKARPERWLNAVVVHVAAHFRDKAAHRRSRRRTWGWFLRLLSETGPEQALDSADDINVLEQILDRLDPTLRNVLERHDLNGEPMSSIAESYGIPLSTAYKWRNRAFLRSQSILRKILEEDIDL